MKRVTERVEQALRGDEPSRGICWSFFALLFQLFIRLTFFIKKIKKRITVNALDKYNLSFSTLSGKERPGLLMKQHSRPQHLGGAARTPPRAAESS